MRTCYLILLFVSISASTRSPTTPSSTASSYTPSSETETVAKRQTDGHLTLQHSGRIVELEVGEQVTISCVSSNARKAAVKPVGCFFNLDANSPKFPAHVVDDGNQIVQPTLDDKTRWMSFSSGQQVTVWCPGNGNVLTATNRQVNAATCINGKLLIDGHSLAYEDLGCHSQVKETIRETGTCSTGTLVEIGWQIGDTFIHQLSLCHGKSSANTLYAINTINGASIQADDESNKRPAFRKGNYFNGIDIDKGYSKNGQERTLTKILGSSAAAKYIDVGKSHYFARGHLAPDGDFIDAASQDATYYFINCLPQWQSFNNGNWKALESAVRNLASERRLNLSIYTGGFNVLTLTDSRGVQKPIYLDFDVNNNGLVPVPKYFWKIVHDPISKRGVAFVGINNPHLHSVTPADIICPNICQQVPWMTWRRENIQSGYMFCCTVAELNRAIPFSPKLDAVQLLI